MVLDQLSRFMLYICSLCLARISYLSFLCTVVRTHGGKRSPLPAATFTHPQPAATLSKRVFLGAIKPEQ